MGHPIDSPRDVRGGDALPLDALRAYLEAQHPKFAGGIEQQQFPGGHSNLTYLLRIGEREVVLRRPPFGPKIKSAHDMGREYRILSGLIDVYPRVPRPLLYCDDESVIGAPFYLMERVRGVILRKRQQEGLTPEVMRRLSEATIDNLAQVHAVDLAAAGLQTLGKPEGYVSRQVEGWTQRYENASTDEISEIDQAARWLHQHLPQTTGATLIHNDYKYDNIVLDADDLGRIVAVLDWEMATVGDPLMDLGTTLSLWVDPDDPIEFRSLPFGPTMLPGNLSRREIVARYAETTGRDVSNALYYFVYGLFKMAVVLQQIYKRYKSGFSKDPRFGMMIHGVRAFGKTASLALERGRIDRLG